MKCSGFRDRHLNVFINYASDSTNKEVEYLENNITKAFINTLESLGNGDEIKAIFTKLFEIELPDQYKCEYFLQWKSNNEEIKSVIKKIKKENRFLFAFSPTGKHWGYIGSDIKKEDEMEKSIREHYKNEYSGEELEKRVKYELKYIKRIHDVNSVPDALIILYLCSPNNDLIPEYAIAFENKKYDLDPFQINNHLEKSLELTDNQKESRNVIYKKYEDICNAIKSFGMYMTDCFIEYMTILEYYDSDDFVDCFYAEKELRQKLCIHFGKEILNEIKKSLAVNNGKKLKERKKSEYSGIDRRDKNTWRLHVCYDYLKEINLVFSGDKDKVYLSLAFASKQVIAQKMYSSLNTGLFNNIPDYMKPKSSFHLQICHVGKNISESYVSFEKLNISIKEYVDYWQKNKDLIKTTKIHDEQNNSIDVIAIYRRMMDDGIITADDYNSIYNYFIGRNYEVLVVPELLFEPEWTYEEIGEMGEENFIKEIKGKINYALSLFDLPVKS